MSKLNKKRLTQSVIEANRCKKNTGKAVIPK